MLIQFATSKKYKSLYEFLDQLPYKIGDELYFFNKKTLYIQSYSIAHITIEITKSSRHNEQTKSIKIIFIDHYGQQLTYKDFYAKTEKEVKQKIIEKMDYPFGRQKRISSNV